MASIIDFGEFQRGETVTLVLRVDDGDIADVGALPTAHLKPIKAGRYTIPGDEVESVTTLIVNQIDADEDGPAGWTFTVPASVTATLPKGRYVTDALLLLGDGEWRSDALRFRLVDGVTQ